MKRGKFDSLMSPSRLKLLQILMAVVFFYMLFMSFEIPLVLRTGLGSASGDEMNSFISDALPRPLALESEGDFADKDTPARPADDTLRSLGGAPRRTPTREFKKVSGLAFNDTVFDANVGGGKSSELHKAAKHAWAVGRKLWDELESGRIQKYTIGKPEKMSEQCPHSITLSGSDFKARNRVLVLPCGLTLWSHITVVGNLDFGVFLSIHFYHKGWVLSQCLPLAEVKCEKWIRDDDNHSEESKALWWLNRLIGRTKKVTIDWPYPFAEGRLFVLTVSAGLEGYHVNVDGRHVTSFPYRTGFVLEDATGLFVNGDVDVHSVFAASLPTSHPSFAPQMHLEMSTRWKAPPLPNGRVELFIGILSAGNHFAERMAVRKSWMQHKLIKSSHVVARFFVALHGRKEVNVELKKEADYFGDIVIVPYMDNYDLVVLKTIAICEYGHRTAAAKHIMKCDDDTFVRVDTVLKEAHKVNEDKSLYIGNINYHHKPLRYGKWAVTYEEWPEEDYPAYANGPGYIISSDIAEFIISEFEMQKLRLFKMEDVSMGMWVEQFNSSKPVEYVHSVRFCQFGCIDDYYTAHYQSPRQMMCMWGKLQQHGRPQCCNMR
ncbi:hypothetical protein TIFTF001_010961 [Ficus carica]|uniref:Galectin domain-containing protein n=1 Tax=Ficus carica TaxID=3494 RepID=A0AA88DHS8_FICCA|nr:hypothetical protein TIFTF001_010961 [Ficus carica]